MLTIASWGLGVDPIYVHIFSQKNFGEKKKPHLPNTVDGRNPATVEVGSSSHHLQGLEYIPGLAWFQPSTILGQSSAMPDFEPTLAEGMPSLQSSNAVIQVVESSVEFETSVQIREDRHQKE